MGRRIENECSRSENVLGGRAEERFEKMDMKYACTAMASIVDRSTGFGRVMKGDESEVTTVDNGRSRDEKTEKGNGFAMGVYRARELLVSTYE